MTNTIQQFDKRAINFLQKLEDPFARTAIFLIYFWFGFLKLIGVSPATPLVQALFEQTINFLPFHVFYFLFSLFETAIGILFLVRGLERLAIFLLGVHIILTILPFFFLPHLAWQGFLVPTLEGQYIIKNILIVAIAITIGSKLTPLYLSRKKTSLDEIEPIK